MSEDIMTRLHKSLLVLGGGIGGMTCVSYFTTGSPLSSRSIKARTLAGERGPERWIICTGLGGGS